MNHPFLLSIVLFASVLKGSLKMTDSISISAGKFYFRRPLLIAEQIRRN